MSFFGGSSPPPQPQSSFAGAHLSLEGSHAGGVDHQTSVAIGVGLVLAHQAGAEADDVEGPH